MSERPKQQKKIFNILIQIAPRKVEQSELGKKANIPPPEMSHIFRIHLKKLRIIIKETDDKQRTFYNIPEEKIMEALQKMNKL